MKKFQLVTVLPLMALLALTGCAQSYDPQSPKDSRSLPTSQISKSPEMVALEAKAANEANEAAAKAKEEQRLKVEAKAKFDAESAALETEYNRLESVRTALKEESDKEYIGYNQDSKEVVNTYNGRLAAANKSYEAKLEIYKTSLMNQATYNIRVEEAAIDYKGQMEAAESDYEAQMTTIETRIEATKAKKAQYDAEVAAYNIRNDAHKSEAQAH